jgi:hypothetical protein
MFHLDWPHLTVTLAWTRTLHPTSISKRIGAGPLCVPSSRMADKPDSIVSTGDHSDVRSGHRPSLSPRRSAVDDALGNPCCDCGRITRHPEVALGFPGEFETCPDGVPAMDSGQRFGRITLKKCASTGSITVPTGWQKFETCPGWGAAFPGRLSLCFSRLRAPAQQPQPGLEPGCHSRS